MEFKKLSNGIEMPMLGYGVYQISPAETKECVKNALEVGYRLIDTAQGYQNEEGVGAAIKESGIDRSEIFITDKIWLTNIGYEKTKASLEESLQKLQTDYIDLMLLHQPYGDIYGSWRALEEAYQEGKVKAIGVSNFYADRLVEFCTLTNIPPMINQVETHVYFQQKKLRQYHEKYNVVTEAWGPFAEGRKDFFNDPLLIEFGERHRGKTSAQVALRFLIQEGIVVIPKTVRRERMEENLNVFDFELSKGEMETMRSLDTNKTYFFDHEDPEIVEWFMDRVKPKMIPVDTIENETKE